MLVICHRPTQRPRSRGWPRAPRRPDRASGRTLTNWKRARALSAVQPKKILILNPVLAEIETQKMWIQRKL